MAAAQDQLVQAFRDFESKLADVREAAENGDRQAIVEAATALPQAAQDFQSEVEDVRRQMDAAGVPVGG